MPITTPNPVTIIPAKTSGGSLKNAANLISYSGAAQGEAKELWGATTKALRDAQSQLDGVTNALRASLPLPDPIQVVDSSGILVASIGQFLSPLTNASYQGIWGKNIAMDWDPLAHGAKGDNSTDDTNALQQTITNSGGILYLSPGKIFKTSATLTFPTTNFLTMIWGGGGIISSATPAVSISGSQCNVLIEDIFIEAAIASGVALSIVNNTSGWKQIRNCFFSVPSGTGTGIILNNNAAGGFSIVGCTFDGGLTTGIALTTQLDVAIIGSDFGASITTPVSTSGTCTYNLRGCNVLDFYNPQVSRALAYQGTATQSVTSGVSTTLTFDTNLYNFGNIHSTTTNPTRFTAPVKGSYLAACNWGFNSSAAGKMSTTIEVNGSVTIPTFQTSVNQDVNIQLQPGISAVLQLNANDFVEFLIFQSLATNNTLLNSTYGSLTLLSQP